MANRPRVVLTLAVVLALATSPSVAQDRDEAVTPESICPVDPEAEALAEGRAEALDRARAAVDVTKRTVDDAFERADRYWRGRVANFVVAFNARVSEVAVSEEEGERSIGLPSGADEPVRSHVNGPTCRTLAARELSACDVIADPDERQACFVWTMALSISYGAESPDDAFCEALMACPGACCRLLFFGDASGCDGAVGRERRACQRVRQMRDGWRERCGPGERGLGCLGSLIALAHQHGQGACEWPIAAYGEGDRTAHLRRVCMAALTGQPALCDEVDPGRGAVPYRHATDATLMAASGVSWWVVAAMGSVPSVCHVRGRVFEGDRQVEAVAATVWSRGVALPKSTRVRLGAGVHASRARVETESACVPIVDWR